MLGTLAMGCAIGWAENASATLLDRGPNMVYDTTLDITWTRDANLSGQPKTWQDANAWAASLVLEGFDDWRLPSVSVSGLPYPLNAATFGSTFTYACAVNYLGSPEEIACRDDELAYMYWYNLLGAGLDQTGNQVSYLGTQLITNIQAAYWSSTAFFPNTNDRAWLVYFTAIGSPPPGGYFQVQAESFPYAAWAVRDGDVAAVPEPASGLLLVSGLAALGYSRRKRRPVTIS
jgi:hypothetical protein